MMIEIEIYFRNIVIYLLLSALIINSVIISLMVANPNCSAFIVLLVYYISNYGRYSN